MEEIGAITGRRSASYEDAIAALHRYVEAASPQADEELLRFFYRQQSRMEALMPGAVGRSEGRSFSPLAVAGAPDPVNSSPASTQQRHHCLKPVAPTCR